MEFKCTSLSKLPYSTVNLLLCKSILLLLIYLYVILTIIVYLFLMISFDLLGDMNLL